MILIFEFIQKDWEFFVNVKKASNITVWLLSISVKFILLGTGMNDKIFWNKDKIKEVFRKICLIFTT